MIQIVLPEVTVLVVSQLHSYEYFVITFKPEIFPMALALLVGHLHWGLLGDPKTSSVGREERSERAVFVLLDAKSEEVTEVGQIVEALSQILHSEFFKVMMADVHEILDIEVGANQEIAIGS